MTNEEAKNLIHLMVLGLGDTPKEFETQSIIDIKESLTLAIKALENQQKDCSNCKHRHLPPGLWRPCTYCDEVTKPSEWEAEE